MNSHKIEFKKHSDSALKNENLQKALRNTTDRFRAARRRASEERPDWEILRTRARAIKKEVISRLDFYLEELERGVINAGGSVHWAVDADEAARIIVDIATASGTASVVKSKSMATEEIELNHAFERAGIRPVETDLGEYIIQLAGETPSHIIAPAIHKSKADISKLFSEKLGVPYYDDPKDLTREARARLRQEFLIAGVGVSGVNIAVAETGTIVIVENEGNARLSTTLPKIHVALMGIEKLIPKYEDLPVFLSLLARSATGQKMSTYVSFITGAKREGDLDGAEQFHLVILDNGRSQILASPEMRESLYCIRCGACLNICPVYRQVGGHSYGWVYSGPIGAIITPQLLGIDKAPELPFASTLCGACKDVCPVKIDIPRVLLNLRKRIIERKSAEGTAAGGLIERAAVKLWAFAMRHEKLYKFGAAAAYFLQKPWIRGKMIKSLPAPFSNWTKHRDLTPVAGESFRDKWKRMKNG
ncbi:MAG: LutB/LldF family L-lactate oxidation iron-sulfur protein [Deltaproteobacteria bacterium]